MKTAYDYFIEKSDNKVVESIIKGKLRLEDLIPSQRERVAKRVIKWEQKQQ